MDTFVLSDVYEHSHCIWYLQSSTGEERRDLIGAAASTASSPYIYFLPELHEHDGVCEHVWILVGVFL